jgi:RNA polymerase sigma-70 factor (ECF subfamily)
VKGKTENPVDRSDLQQFKAYRMLGSAAEAEDILQEAFLRYQAISSGEVNSPKAFLSTVVTRLCLNRLESARNQRETYIGPWLGCPSPS